MKTTFSILLLLAVTITGFSQTHYLYDSDGEKFYMDLDYNYVNVTTNESFNISSLNGTELELISINTDERASFGSHRGSAKIAINASVKNAASYTNLITQLKQLPGIEGVYPYFSTEDGPVGTSNFFYVKLKSATDIQLLEETASQNNVEIFRQSKSMPLWYIMSSTKENSANALTTSSKFYETGFFDKVDAAVLSLVHTDSNESTLGRGLGGDDDSIEDCSHVNDPAEGDQWNIFNNPTYPLADINVCEAWDKAKGFNAKIAILDVGIKHAVTDLLVTDYHLTSGPNVAGPWYYGNNAAHGTNVAGIAAAKHNTTGIAGIAPDVLLYNVANELGITLNHTELADGINWSAQTQQVDVINMSFANTGSVPQPLLQMALDNAINLGRAGRGTILVAGAGNNPSNQVQFPANYPGVLAVGGSLSTGNPNLNYNYGDDLDVVAPSAGVTTTSFFNNNGTSSFGGTSASTPHVTGVAALMVSAKGSISGEAVRNVIRRTAQKAGNVTYDPYAHLDVGSWDDHMGYGIVDAKECVFTADAFDTANLDAHMRNSADDYGIEPDQQTKTLNTNFWSSPDIWAPDLANDFYVHTNPVYTGTGTTTVFVRVINKSNTAVPINSLNVKLYWSKQANSSSWPHIWDGSTTQQNSSGNSVVTGGLVDSMNNTTGDIKPGEQGLYWFQWTVPNPDDYDGVYSKVSDKYGFSFLARIDSALDPMTTLEGTSVWSNAKNNNNVVWKNVTVDVLAPVAPPSIASEENRQFSIVPNPSNGSFQIASITEDLNELVSIEITDFYGNQVFNTQNYNVGEQLDLRAAARDGLYFVRITTESGEIEIHKLIVGAK